MLQGASGAVLSKELFPGLSHGDQFRFEDAQRYPSVQDGIRGFENEAARSLAHETGDNISAKGADSLWPVCRTQEGVVGREIGSHSAAHFTQTVATAKP